MISMSKGKILRISDFVGGGYNDFWKFRGRYRVVKGSRASKKSKTTALWFASWLNKKGYEQANLIVFRKTYRTIKNSCFTDLKWALNRLGVIDDWEITLSPLEMRRKSTGQVRRFPRMRICICPLTRPTAVPPTLSGPRIPFGARL